MAILLRLLKGETRCDSRLAVLAQRLQCADYRHAINLAVTARPVLGIKCKPFVNVACQPRVVDVLRKAGRENCCDCNLRTLKLSPAARTVLGLAGANCVGVGAGSPDAAGCACSGVQCGTYAAACVLAGTCWGEPPVAMPTAACSAAPIPPPASLPARWGEPPVAMPTACIICWRGCACRRRRGGVVFTRVVLAWR
jgi:hypothetical protein